MPDPIVNARRVGLLKSLGLLNVDSDPSLDRLARIAARSIQAPIALVTFLSSDRQINKARVGIEDPYMSLTDAFCVCALDSPDLLLVEDARKDSRFAASSLVTGPRAVRSYAGQPIVLSGIVLGTVCVLDVVVRTYDAAARDVLLDLGGLVSDLLQVRLEQHMRRQEQQRAFDAAAAAGEWLWETDAYHRLAWLAGSHDGEAGRLSRDKLGQPMAERPLLDGLGKPRKPESMLSSCFLARQPFSALVAAGDETGACFVELSGTPFQDEDKLFSGFRGSSQDVTDRVRAEIRAVDSEAAIQANKNKTELMSRVSHELRTPLNAILGFAELMLMEETPRVKPSPVQRERLEHIRTAGQQLLVLVSDMLDMARVEQGRTELKRVQVKLCESVDRVIRLMAPLASQRQVGIRSLLQPGEGAVLADERALGQVLLNLLSNAVNYNRPGGIVTVRVEVVASMCKLFVEDNGQGIAESRMSELFQPFRRLGPEGNSVQGSGLGLVISRALVEAMGGELLMSSVEGVGTSAEVRLPTSLADNAVAPAPAHRLESQANAAVQTPRRMLYVEDNPVNVIILQELISTEPNWSLVCAEDGRSGIEMAELHRIDLAFIDMHLPDMNGIDVLSALRDRRLIPPYGCIVLSADAMPEQIRVALEAGFVGYWTKPLDLHAALTRLRALLSEPPPIPAQ